MMKQKKKHETTKKKKKKKKKKKRKEPALYGSYTADFEKQEQTKTTQLKCNNDLEVSEKAAISQDYYDSLDSRA